MTKILLIDPDECHARELANFLERQGLSVQVCNRETDGVNELGRDGAEYDVVILEVTGSRLKVWEVLGDIRTRMGTRTTTPGIICICRGYRGPQLRMRIERMGAKLVYERTE
jgi:DNA-binding response OmpR family regulator